MAEAVKRDPYEKRLSENVVVLYGWKDGHAVVKVRVPPGSPVCVWYPVEVPADAIARFTRHFKDAHDHGLKPEPERAMPEPVQFQARDDCRGRWGYRDGHVELDVKRVFWITLKFPFDEFLLAKAAMDEAKLWADLPAEVREMQGA